MTRPSDTCQTCGHISGFHNYCMGNGDLCGCTGFTPPSEPARLAGAGAQVTEAIVEIAAEASHDVYEKAADVHGWETQRRSRKPWADVPEANKATVRDAMRAALSAALPHMGTGQAEADQQIINELTRLVGVFQSRADRDRNSKTGNAAIVLTYDDAAAVVRERLDQLRALLDRPAAAEGSNDANV